MWRSKRQEEIAQKTSRMMQQPSRKRKKNAAGHLREVEIWLQVTWTMTKTLAFLNQVLKNWKKRKKSACIDIHIAVLTQVPRAPNEQQADSKAQPSWADIAREIAKLYVEQAQPDESTFKPTKSAQGPKQNSRVRNWMVAMRRNFRSEDKNKALAPFTITRDRMDEVRNVVVSITYVTTA